MTSHVRLLLLLGAMACSHVHADSTTYTPAPVFCADGSSALCATVPSFIGDDPALMVGDGYQGLSNDVTSSTNDAQTPFDNMAWQMFVALNWQADQPGGAAKTGLAGDGTTVWQTWAHPEDVFGGTTGSCENPEKLQRFNLIAKSAKQGSLDEEIMQATGQPLIDVNGNWTLYERRLNPTEQAYIVGNGLDSIAGQQIFAKGGNTVAFPNGGTTATGTPGAIEVKASWRIVDASEAANYFTTRGLIDVEDDYVADGKPLCATVTLGLVGLHITQNNVAKGALLANVIWASFEHKANAPVAAAACAATDNNCYTTIKSVPGSPNICPAGPVSGSYSYYAAACSEVVTNTPPVHPTSQKDFVWQRTPPYAGAYMTKQGSATCGTQVTHCWQVYDLTQQLNTAWQAQLADIGSVFANYYLIGTNWAGSIEPLHGRFNNGSVPAFLGNSTMETYIQSDPKFGNCAGCHAGATLAYTDTSKKPAVTYASDFSFLPGLATRTCADANAGPLWNNAAAQETCPTVCSGNALAWNGQWTTTVPGTQSVCGCCVAAEHATAAR